MRVNSRFEWERLAFAQPFNGEAMRVLWCYASHADAETLLTFPKVRDVAAETGISVEKVGRFRRELLAAGWLVESDETTTRGNPKLMLAVGESVKEKSYLGEKKAMSPKSTANLVPAARQKKAAGCLDTPDGSGLGHREKAGLEHREIEGLDTPDVTTSELNNPSQTINNNPTAPAVAGAPPVPVETDSSLQRENGTPYMGKVWGTKDGHLLFEVSTGDGRYLLCEDGVSSLTESASAAAPASLDSDRTPAAPVVVGFPPERQESIRAEVAKHVGAASWDDWPEEHAAAVLALALDPTFAPYGRDDGRVMTAHERARRDMARTRA